MTDKELNEIIDWCRKKLSDKQKYPYDINRKQLEGYEKAMLAVMSHLHTLKGGAE